MLSLLHTCQECNTRNRVTVDFSIDDADFQKVTIQHPDWVKLLARKSAKLGIVTCPDCSTKNYIAIFRKREM